MVGMSRPNRIMSASCFSAAAGFLGPAPCTYRSGRAVISYPSERPSGQTIRSPRPAAVARRPDIVPFGMTEEVAA